MAGKKKTEEGGEHCPPWGDGAPVAHPPGGAGRQTAERGGGRSFAARVKSQSEPTEGVRLLTLEPLVHTPRPEPGQFYMLGLPDRLDPLLKRPLSFLGYTPEGDLRFLYRVVGHGTRLMAETLSTGDRLEMLGPLGRPYPMPGRKETPVLLAGGLGMPSVFSLAERLVNAKKHKDVFFLYGARSRSDFLLLDELGNLGVKLELSTDDGSEGKRGTVCDLLERVVRSRASSPASDLALYACGPEPMLKAAVESARALGIRKCHVSMEEYMACGIGACMGCAVPSAKKGGGYLRACKEGPVFAMNEIDWARTGGRRTTVYCPASSTLPGGK